MMPMETSPGGEPPVPASTSASAGADSVDRGTGGSLLVGFDGSHGAATAIAVAGQLLPGRHVRVAHLWTSPAAGSHLHRRLAARAWTNDDLDRLVRREAAAAAKDVAAGGVALAEAAGWSAEPLVQGIHGEAGVVLTELAAELRPTAIVLGSRGIGGLRGMLGSVSAQAVRHSPVPVLVVPPLLDEERAGAGRGPVIAAHDGSVGAERARAVAVELFPGREHVVTHVETPAVGWSSSHADDGPEPQSGDGPEPPPEAMRLVAAGWGPRAVADALSKEAAIRGAGVIVIGSRGRSMLRETLLGSHAKAVLQHGHRAVLVVPR
jgi:nucleotide-binding universal stress UspA family protein